MGKLLTDNPNDSLTVKSIKDFLNHFKILLMFMLVILLWGAGVFVYFQVEILVNSYESTNTERITSERVFDNADVLTDKEEAKLRKLIAKREKQTQCDIVLVTLNQSLADYEVEYRNNYGYTIYPDEYVMVYADKFWEDMKYGYDQPLILDGTPYSGDGVILVDNIYEEGAYGKCTWFGTQGKAERKYSNVMIDHLLDVVYLNIDSDPYEAYRDYVNLFAADMIGKGLFSISKYSVFPLLVTIIVLIFYIPSKLVPNKGVKTVNARTYLMTDTVSFPVRQDNFIRKSVVRHVHVESSSGGGGGGSHGGGGGHHSSGGGGSHGGGGHHR